MDKPTQPLFSVFAVGEGDFFIMPHLQQGTGDTLCLTVGLWSGRTGKFLIDAVVKAGSGKSMMGRTFVFRAVVRVNASNQVRTGEDDIFQQELGSAT